MKSLSKINFTDVIDRVKQELGYQTDKQVAELFKLSPQDFNKRKSTGSILPIVVDWALNENVDIDWLLTGDGEDQRSKVRAVTKVLLEGKRNAPDPEEFDWVPMAEAHLNAGGGAFVLSERMKELYAFRKVWLRKVATSKQNVVLMLVEGDSMTPTIAPGDVVMIDRGRSRIKSGLIYALGIDDTIIIKRLELMASGQICVISDNRAEYPPYEASPASIRILGQVIWFARQLVRDEPP